MVISNKYVLNYNTLIYSISPKSPCICSGLGNSFSNSFGKVEVIR